MSLLSAVFTSYQVFTFGRSHQLIINRVSPHVIIGPPQVFSRRKQRTSNMEASTENLHVSGLSITGEENRQHAPIIKESLGKRELLSSADKLLLEYLCRHEPVFNELDDVRNKVRSPLDPPWSSNICPPLMSV